MSEVARVREARKRPGGGRLVRRNVAGMDVGNAEHWVCAPTMEGEGRDVGTFGSTGALTRTPGTGDHLTLKGSESCQTALPL